MRAGVRKLRTLPRTYDLSSIAKYLRLLHVYPLPLIELETRKMNDRVSQGNLPKEAMYQITQWKSRVGVESSEESEYRYLMRDLGLIEARKIDLEVDSSLPMGGEGPFLDTLRASIEARMFYLTPLGEKMLGEYHTARSTYEDHLFC